MSRPHANWKTRRPLPTRPVPEFAYFRSIGAVVEHDGKWAVQNAAGEIISTHSEKWMAWHAADQLGSERIANPRVRLPQHSD